MATPPAMALAVAMSITIFFIPAFAQVYLWPQPRFIQWETGKASFVLNTTFFIDSPLHPELRQAARRCRDLIFKENWLPLQVSSFWPPNSGSLQYLSNLSIRVEDLLADLQHGVDESYSLSVDSLNGAVLAAATPWGAIHGLETFSQLIRRKNASSDVLLIQNGVTIWDAPLFPHRGVLLDTSRNFYPVADILRTIKAMGHNKLNVFHWHITDSQSFPIHISSEPDLSAKGSYGSRFTYYPADVKKIISYARSVGVRVMPEIDAPAHSASWGSAYPEIVTCQNEFWSDSSKPWSERMASEPGPGQLNPLNPKTYTVVKNVIDAIADLFPESFFHAGGDEVAPACWETDQAIAQLVTRLGRPPAMRYLLDKFIKNTYPKITSHSKMVVYWEDILLGAEANASSSLLPKSSTIIQTWSAGLSSTKTITEAGYRAIVSSNDFYYLDCGHGGFLGNDSQYDTMEDGGDGGSWCNPFKTWQKIYDFDITAGLSKKEKNLVLGGEVALWSEQSDGTVVDSRIWPRAAAIAESLWSGNRGSNGKKRYGEALSRLNDWRYRLVARGISAEPLQPFWCLKHPGQCDA